MSERICERMDEEVAEPAKTHVREGSLNCYKGFIGNVGVKRLGLCMFERSRLDSKSFTPRTIYCYSVELSGPLECWRPTGHARLRIVWEGQSSAQGRETYIQRQMARQEQAGDARVVSSLCEDF